MKIIVSVFIELCIAFTLFPVTMLSQSGTAINFQNISYMTHGDFIYCGSPNYGFTNQLTVTAWVKWTTDPGSFSVTPANHENEGAYSTYVAYGSHNSNDIANDNGQFWLRNAKTGNKFEFVVQNTSNAIVTATSTTGPSANTWYFLAGVYDGSNLKLYVNGVLERTISQTGNIKTNDGTHRLSMGRLPWGYGFFVGYLDEIRLWKAALTQTEIQQQMNSSATISPSNLASYWNFNAGTGTAIDDSAPQNADGVFYSAAIDVHSSSDFPNKIINDGDKTWVTDTWKDCTLKTVSGAGIDEVNSIVSNTATTVTVTYGYGGTAPNNKTTPVIDSKTTSNDTWFGIEKSSETTQWVTSDAPMPVEITSFIACPTNNIIELKWTTATELNNFGFEIEKSVNNAQWIKIGFVEGNGTSNSPQAYSFSDVTSQGKLSYRLKQIDRDGKYEYSQQVDVTVTFPKIFVLQQNHPNPFNPSTTITFNIPERSTVRLSIFNMLGQKISEIVNETKDAGSYEQLFNASQLSSGIYFYRIEATSTQNSGKTFVETKRMVLMR